MPNKVCVSNKTEDLNLSVFSMIAGINESKILINISCYSKCRFDGKKCYTIQWWKNVSIKNTIFLKNNIFGILLRAVVKMENI